MPNKLFMLALPIGMALLAPITSPAAHAADASQAATGSYEQLAAQAEGRIGDPEFDYQLGMAALDAGRYGEAVIALQRVLAVQPNNAPARAELARASALHRDIDTPRAAFPPVLTDPSPPAPVRPTPPAT